MAIRGKKTFEKLTIEEISYIAGFFDGEGNINIYKSDTGRGRESGRRITPRYELAIAIYNTDKDVMDWLHSVFGGYQQTRNSENTTNHKKKWKESYTQRLTSNQALEFLLLVYPYLRVKKKQADLAIKFQQYRNNKANRFGKISSEQLEFSENTYLQLRNLIDCCRWRNNNSTAAKRLRPQRLSEKTLEIVKR